MFSILNKDVKSLILSNLTKLSDIVNFLKANPRDRNLLYESITMIESECPIPCIWLGNLRNLTAVKAPIICLYGNDFDFLAKTNWTFLHVLINNRFEHEHYFLNVLKDFIISIRDIQKRHLMFANSLV